MSEKCIRVLGLSINNLNFSLSNKEKIRKIKSNKKKKFIIKRNLKELYPKIYISTVYNYYNYKIVIIKEKFNINYDVVFYYVQIDNLGNIINWCVDNKNLQ